MSARYIFTISCLIIAFFISCSTPIFKLSGPPEIIDLGTPVSSVNWVRLHEGTNRNGNPEIYATMGQNAENLFVLAIDPETGKLRQFVTEVEKANYPTATLMSRSGRLYVGAAYAGHLLCYNPEKELFEDLGAINPNNASFPCAIIEDEDGIIWIGSYGTADLTSYNTATGEFTRHGRMDEVDMYNYPIVNTDGYICNKIMMTRPHLVVFDPKTGKKDTVGPIAEKNKDTFNLVQGPHNRVYIQSSLGNYRIEGFDAIPVDTIPPNIVPDRPQSGISFTFADAAQQLYRKLEVKTADGEIRTFDLDYKAAGTDIFCFHKGPDGNIYGSSILPLHLFRYSPSTGDMTDMGECSAAAGEAYSMATLDGSIYISSYPGARVSVYDPARPYSYGTGEENNPRELDRIDDISYRPRSTLAGPLGRVWLASVPDYGLWGGPLSCYDPQTGEKKAYYRIAGDGSCYTMAYLEKQKLIAVGTSIYGGSGTKPKVDQAVLFLWDYEAEEKVWEGTLDRPVSTFNALCTGRDGRLYGTATGDNGPVIFVFDPDSRSFVSFVELPQGHPLDLSLQNGPDGALYGFTSSCFYRLDPRKLTIKEIVFQEESFDIAGPIVGKDVYFGKGHRLRKIRVF
ncbi:MAG: hypothetical protein JXB48_17240 [Candidatus Latescibacteria bacterium]|nr:hypothetical protein [Candidatus Latescibacterota bacterium]